MKIGENRGFTLIELMVVLVIVGVLLSLAIPGFQKLILYSRLEEARTYMTALAAAERRYLLENNSYYSIGGYRPITYGYVLEDDLYNILGVRLNNSPNFCYTVMCNPNYMTASGCSAPPNTSTDWHFVVIAIVRNGGSPDVTVTANMPGSTSVQCVVTTPNTNPKQTADDWVKSEAGKALFLCWPPPLSGSSSACGLPISNWEEGVTVDYVIN